HRTQTTQSRPEIFHYLADPAGHAMTPQHFKDDVLGAHPVGKLALQPHAEDRRHHRRKWLPRDREPNIQTARPHCHHAKPSGRWRMTVRAQQRFAGYPEALHMHDMADAVTWP